MPNSVYTGLWHSQSPIQRQGPRPSAPCVWIRGDRSSSLGTYKHAHMHTPKDIAHYET